jgi:hypothetical protein
MNLMMHNRVGDSTMFKFLSSEKFLSKLVLAEILLVVFLVSSAAYLFDKHAKADENLIQAGVSRYDSFCLPIAFAKAPMI